MTCKDSRTFLPFGVARCTYTVFNRDMNTETTTSPRRNHVAATIDNNGQRIGHVVTRGNRFQAIRKDGVQGVDIRRVATFRSLTAAVAWVEASA